MIIANPIYDVAFKRLMADDKVAKFFIGTLLNETIETLEVKPQEYTYEGEFAEGDPRMFEVIEDRIKKRHTIWLYRLDYIATIKNSLGETKKILVEIQKARSLMDLMRFRNYLAEQYKTLDTVDGKKTTLPITTIYVLGFNLEGIDTACVKVNRDYIDLINGNKIKQKSEFIEKLTHDCYVVQVMRITERYQTKLDKLLSIFEQNHFDDETTIVKEFNHNLDEENIKAATDILHFMGTEPAEKKKLENEREALRILNVYYNNMREKIEETEKILENRVKELEEKNKTIEDNEKELIKKEKSIIEKNQALSEKDQALSEKDQALSEKDQALSEKDQKIEEIQRQLLNQQKLIEELMKKFNNSN